MAAVGLRMGDLVWVGDADDDPGGAEDDEEGKARRAKAKERRWVKNFYAAYDALENFDWLQHGIHLSKTFQSLLVKAGVEILEKNKIVNMKRFRFAVINRLSQAGADGPVRDTEITVFARSVAHIQRLASFLMSARREYKTDVPLVVAMLDEETDMYLVVGMLPLSRCGEIHKNAFGVRFREVALELNVQTQLHLFDSSVIKVPREDLKDFLDRLKRKRIGVYDDDDE
ncbi:hypothetical protein HK104_006676 [Borealophlyctis nickersoniae]|nr:hypothetical protein HK104_006676 [Borealophlyctis nickersoniae]